VEPDEGIEDQGINSTFFCGLSILEDFINILVGNIPHIINEEVHNGGDGEDVKSHSVDLFPHGGGHQWVSFLNGRVSDDGWVGSFRSEGNSSEGIHDQVDPEKLRDGEG